MEKSRDYKPNTKCPYKTTMGYCNQKLQASGMKYVVCCNGHKYPRHSPPSEEEKDIMYKKLENKPCKFPNCNTIMVYKSSCGCGSNNHDRLLRCTNGHKWRLDEDLVLLLDRTK